MEGARLVHPTLGHQEMEMGVKIDPVAKGLDDLMLEAGPVVLLSSKQSKHTL